MYTSVGPDATRVTPSVDALRNEIRVSVGRYERVESTAFTKEALAAVCEALECDLDANGRPSKGERRAAIRRRVDGIADGDDGGDRPFRKAELQAIADELRDE